MEELDNLLLELSQYIGLSTTQAVVERDSDSTVVETQVLDIRMVAPKPGSAKDEGTHQQ